MRFNNTQLVIWAFSTVFYARIVCTITGLPSILIHAHLVVVPIVFAIAVFTTPTKDRQQIKIISSLLTGLFIFAIAVFVSAFWNKAGIVNAIASLGFLGEPILFLTAIVCIPMTIGSLTSLKKWCIWSVAINFALAAVQKPLIDAELLYARGFNGTDGCGGVFFISGAGNYVSASVSFIFALYFLVSKKAFPLWIRLTVFLAAFWQILFSDSKQILFAFAVAWLCLVFINLNDVGKTIKLLLAIITTGLFFVWCEQNIDALNGYFNWLRPELFTKDGDAWYAKFYGVRNILTQFESPLNWLFGLGPGHTVSRLGAWFLQDYSSILKPLGATTSSIGIDTREFVNTFWLTYSSSMFSPIFGWAGIWGDLGLFGLSTYFYLGYLVWQNFCFDDSLKVTLLSIFVMGFIFTQLEEPGYTISVAMLLGVAWQEQKIHMPLKLSRTKNFLLTSHSSLSEHWKAKNES